MSIWTSPHRGKQKDRKKILHIHSHYRRKRIKELGLDWRRKKGRRIKKREGGIKKRGKKKVKKNEVGNSNQ